MAKSLCIGLLRETKSPPDKRVPLTPRQVATLRELYPHAGFYVQPSKIRCYSDKEYADLGIPLTEDLSACDILMGVKEVDISTFIPGKTYLFFAHVGKKQPHNREMFRAMVDRKIRLIDYEYLVKDGVRVVAFGYWAGIIGAYNGLRAWGLKNGSFRLKPANECHDLKEAWDGLRKVSFTSPLKVLVTGEGRVAGGVMETLAVCNFLRVPPHDYLTREYDVPVVCQIGPEHYVRRRDGIPFDFGHFVKNAGLYESTFLPFTKVTDMYISSHFWDPASPPFFRVEDTRDPDWRISVIADISCDVGIPVPTTLRATSIADPFYDYDRATGREVPAFSGRGNITVMSIDNLPGELPRDASADFGKQLMATILTDLLSGQQTELVRQATITESGRLTDRFAYLEDYLRG